MTGDGAPPAGPAGRRSLRARMRAGDKLLGVLVRMPNEGLVELSGLVGLDFVVIDTEHGPADQIPLLQHTIAAQAHGLAVLVRIGHPADVLRVLDLGVDGIIAPHVSNVHEARAIVRAAHYPPRGERGFAGYTRAGDYGLKPAADHLSRAAETVVIAMIEDRAGLADAAAIAGADGIDGLLLGPADLSCDLGVPGRTDDPRVRAAAHDVARAARAASGAVVTIVADRGAARAGFEGGADLVIVNAAAALGTLFRGFALSRPEAHAAPSSPRETLVLLSGMLGDGTLWDGVAGALADRVDARTVRIDLDETIAEMAANVLACSPPRFALAGHSLGAIVALEVARQAPDRVSRLALLNSSGRAPAADQLRQWARHRSRVEDGQFPAVAAELARSTLPEGKRQDEALVARNAAMARAIGPGGFLRQLAAQAARPDSLFRLAALHLPVLVVSGAQDEVSPPFLQRELVAGIDGAEHAVIEAAGHMTPLEDPLEVARHLRRWLERD